MKALLGMIALVAMTSLASAQDDQRCEQVRDGVWVCDMPERPVPPPTCRVFGDSLVCSGQVDEKRKPANCGWRKGRYVCW